MMRGCSRTRRGPKAYTLRNSDGVSSLEYDLLMNEHVADGKSIQTKETIEVGLLHTLNKKKRAYKCMTIHSFPIEILADKGA